MTGSESLKATKINIKHNTVYSQDNFGRVKHNQSLQQF